MENLEEKKKKVDDAWKQAVEKEKTAPGQSEEYPQEMNFGLFLSSLMIEGLVALGEVENPVTKTKELNAAQARYIIDLLSILQDKTKNNLDADEKAALEQILYELRMRYVSKVK